MYSVAAVIIYKANSLYIMGINCFIEFYKILKGEVEVFNFQDLFHTGWNHASFSTIVELWRKSAGFEEWSDLLILFTAIFWKHTVNFSNKTGIIYQWYLIPIFADYAKK